MKRILLISCLFLAIAGIHNNVLAQTLMPASGTYATNNCGTNIPTLLDAGGAGNYANNYNGFYFLRAGGTAVINISGNYNVENGWDFIRIYSGEGIGGALLATYTGTGVINYTGTPGQTLTIRFTSDGSITAPGFSLAVTYSGVCPTIVTVPFSGNNSIACGTQNVSIQDAGGGVNYANNSNGYTVLNSVATSTSVININGSYWTEGGWDFIRIYSGVGIGGTLLATYSGAGAINYTGTPGQTLTVRFTSDNTVVNPGFYLNINYTGVCSGLPIELISFTADCDDGNRKIDWVTASEINNDYFIIERSFDAINWNEVHREVGAGNSNTTLFYSWTDSEILAEKVIYYRLTQFDFNGQFETFEIVSVSCSSSHATAMVWPSPNDGGFNVRFSEDADQNVLLVISNSMGTIVFEQSVQATGSDQIVLFSLEEKLAPGIYYLTIHGKTTQTLKVTVGK